VTTGINLLLAFLLCTCTLLSRLSPAFIINMSEFFKNTLHRGGHGPEVQRPSKRKLKSLFSVNILSRHISFLTSKDGAYGNLKEDTILTYNAVITNLGNAYNPATGIFAAPVKGLYYFTFFAHGGGEDRIRLVLKKDGAVVVDIHDHPSSADPADNAGNAVFLELEQGNQVYVTILANSAVWADGFATTFSGVLLSKS
uniref:C1q domain-containing protein n=1 Tax=Oryzias melastigma TaxID=30732 RepID=A0A3B3CCD2_ORYME